MSILTLIIVLVVVGVVLWAINRFIPMDAKVKMILNIVVIIILIVWLLKATGLLGRLDTVRL